MAFFGRLHTQYQAGTTTQQQQDATDNEAAFCQAWEFEKRNMMVRYTSSHRIHVGNIYLHVHLNVAIFHLM